MSTKGIRYTLIGLLAAVALAACVTPGPEAPGTRTVTRRAPTVISAPTNAPEPDSTPTPVVPSVEVRLLGRAYTGPSEAVRLALMQECNIVPDLVQDYGEYMQRIELALAAGTEVDLLELSSTNFQHFAEQGFLAPLSEAPESLPSGYLEPALEAFTLGDELYALPSMVNTEALYYNRDLFEQAGLDDPQELEGWSDLFEIAGQITEATGEPGLCLDTSPYVFALYAQSSGARLVEADRSDTRLDGPEVISLAEELQALFESGAAALPEELETGACYIAFGQGRAAMAIAGSWFEDLIANDFQGLNYGVSLLPGGETGVQSLLYASGYAVSANTQHEEARIAIDCMNRTENLLRQYEAGGRLPARAGLASEIRSETRPYATVFYKAAGHSVSYPYWGPAHEAVYAALRTALSRVYHGEDVASSFGEGAAEIRGMLQEAGD
jgi:multiple sugar transport system substrate-binding protein